MEEIINKIKSYNSTIQIIGLNVLVFVCIHIFGTIIGKKNIVNFLALHSNFGYTLFHPWQLVTNFFTHYGIFHILGNMLVFYFSSSIISEMWGHKHTWKFYMFAGLFSGIISLLFYTFFGINSTSIGASGAVCAFMILAAFISPNIEVLLLFIPIKLKYLAGIYVFIDLFLFNNNDGISHIAHLGGYLFGFLYYKYYRSGIFDIFKPKNKEYKKNLTKEATLDIILDKINKRGMGSLNNDERAFLKRMSK